MNVGADLNGTVTPHPAGLDTGDDLVLSGPSGTASSEGDEDLRLLAGGSAISVALGVAERALSVGGDAAMVYRDDTLIHQARLSAVAREADVRIVGSAATLQAAVAAVHHGGRQAFDYGFAAYLGPAMDALDAVGGRPEAAKMENYG